MPEPSPQEQVEFLQKVQRLLSEGQFVASYKFALLRSLCDLAVVKGDDSGDELELTVSEIAEAFVELYWRQTRPFCAVGSSEGQVLRQNTGQQAAIVRTIAQVQAEYNSSLRQLRLDAPRWNDLVKRVADVVAVMPLWKLQRVGEETVDFLYPNEGRGRSIRLRPGVVYCMRRFYGILRNLIEGAWIGYVRSVNLQALGHTADLGAFLFGSEREALAVYQPLLRDIQSDCCFYCHQALRREGDVDHFIPWSRYPVDLGHNFVLAHRACNARKRDRLAAEEHLARWTERNALHGNSLSARFQEARLVSDLAGSMSIARWAYSQTAQMNGMVWVRDDMLCHLGDKWRSLLAVA